MSRFPSLPRSLLLWPLLLVALLSPPPAGGAPQAPEPAQGATAPAAGARPPAGEAEIEALRRLLLADPRLRRPEAQEALARLAATSPEAYCRGLGEVGDLLAAAQEIGAAAGLFLRAIEACPPSGEAVLALSALAGSEQFPCRDALSAVDPTPAPEDPGQAYLAAFGASVIRMICAGDGAPPDLLETMTDFRASRAFGESAPQADGYVRERLLAELNRRAGRRRAEPEHVRRAVEEACASNAALEALAQADAPRSPGPADAPALDATSFLGEVWRHQLFALLDREALRCLADLDRRLAERKAGPERALPDDGLRELRRILGTGDAQQQ